MTISQRFDHYCIFGELHSKRGGTTQNKTKKGGGGGGTNLKPTELVSVLTSSVNEYQSMNTNKITLTQLLFFPADHLLQAHLNWEEHLTGKRQNSNKYKIKITLHSFKKLWYCTCQIPPISSDSSFVCFYLLFPPSSFHLLLLMLPLSPFFLRSPLFVNHLLVKGLGRRFVVAV